MRLIRRSMSEFGDTWPRCGCHRWTPCRVNKVNHPTRRPAHYPCIKKES